MNTAIYARISEDRQDGAGVERQLEDCHSLVTNKGWGDAAVFVDNDFSASRYATKSRPAYCALVEAIRAGDVGRVVVMHTDRLYRQPRELEDIIDLAERGQVEVVSVHSGGMNLSNSDGIAMARVLVAFAAKEGDDKSRRVLRAKKQARERGLSTGAPRSFGWRDGATPDPIEADLIVRATTDLLAGASLHDIARQWAAAGVGRPQSGKPNWSADVVHRIMSSARHAGLIGHRAKGKDGQYGELVIVGPAGWPAIVDREKWERLQALLSHRGAADRVPHRRSLLTGILVCSQCEKNLTRTGSRSAPGQPRRSAWRCRGHVSITAPALEAHLVEATIKRLDTGTFAGIMRRQGREGKRAEDLIQQLGDLATRLETAASAYALGNLSAAAFQAVDAAGQAERDRLQGKLAHVATGSVVAPFVGKPGLLRQRWPELTADQHRALVRIVLGKVAIAPSGKKGMPSFDKSRVTVVAA